MQVWVVFFLAALVGCYGDESECVQKADICVADFLNFVLDHSSGLEQCKVLTKSIECLEKEVVESCAGEEEEDDVKDGIKALKSMKKHNCNFLHIISEDDDIQQCFEENEDYIWQCIIEGTAEVLDALDALPDGIDAEAIDRRMECGLYMRIGECSIKRIEEKCGSEAAGEAMRIISDIPEEVKEACKSINIGLHTGPVAEDKKKK